MNSTEALIARMLETVPMVMRVLGGQLRDAGFDMAPGHLRLLGLLAQGPRTLGELAELQSVSSPTMSNSVTAMAERGWVRRTRDTEDRRKVLIELTDEGCQVLQDIKQQVIAEGAKLCPALTDRECEQVMHGLELIHEVFIGYDRLAAEPGAEVCKENG